MMAVVNEPLSQSQEDTVGRSSRLQRDFTAHHNRKLPPGPSFSIIRPVWLVIAVGAEHAV